MSEYREALQRLVNDGHEQRSYRCEECNPAQMGKKTERVQCPYHAAKALLARGEPEQGEMSDADVRRHYNTACDVFGIGSEARKSGYVLSTNCENAKRRSDCLSLIEREFFTSIEQDEEGEEGECVEKCELPWGAEPDRYVKKFGELLAARVEPAAAEKVLPDDGSYIERPPPKGYASWYDAAVDERLKRVAAEKARERYQEGDVLLFIGWLSGDIAELRKVEVPRLADSWRRFKEALTSPPASKVEAEKAREPMHEGFPVDTIVRDIFTDKVGTIVSYHCRFEVEWADGSNSMDVHSRQLDHCGPQPSPPAATGPCEKCGGAGRLTIYEKSRPWQDGYPIGDEPCPQCAPAATGDEP